MAAALVLTSCSGGGGDGGTASGGGNSAPIKIGIIASFTGTFATQAKDFQLSFTAALEKLTDGSMKIDGRPINILTADDTGDPAIGTTKAKELIGEGVKVIAGPTVSAIALAVAKLAAQNGVLYIGGTSGTSALVGTSNLVFATQGASPAGNQATKAIVKDLNCSSIGAISLQTAYGDDQVKQLKAVVDVPVIPYLLPTSTTDFTPLMLQIKNDPPKCVLSSWTGSGTQQLWSAIGAQGLTKVTSVQSSLVTRNEWPAIADGLGPDALGKTKFTLAYFPGMTGNAEDTFLQDYAKKQGSQLEYDDAVGWAAGEMFFHGVSKGGDDPTAMAKALKDWEFEGPGGQVMIRGVDNQVVVPVALVTLAKDSSGQYQPTLAHLYSAKDLVPPVVAPIK